MRTRRSARPARVSASSIAGQWNGRLRRNALHLYEDAGLRPGSSRLPASEEPAARRASGLALLRVPNGGIQPQAVVDAKGTLHLIYFKGDDATAGDLFYVRREAGTERFSEPIRINSRARSACAVGSVRGGQTVLGKGGRPHVVWNGVGTDYARLNDAGTAFEEQRNLMRETEVPDGGGTVAADDGGNVYVVWHGQRKGDRGEDKRKVWVARSTDDGKTFSIEARLDGTDVRTNNGTGPHLRMEGEFLPTVEIRGEPIFLTFDTPRWVTGLSPCLGADRAAHKTYAAIPQADVVCRPVSTHRRRRDRRAPPRSR